MAAVSFSDEAGKFDAFQGLVLPGESKPQLFIGPVEALLHADELHKGGVTHVLSVLEGGSSHFLDESRFSRLVIDAADDVAFDLLGQWPRCCAFIDAALAVGGAALVHCDAGSSRSGATLVAYLVHRLRQSCGECLLLAQRARSVVQPNEGFLAQLRAWERSQLGSVRVPGGAHMHEIRSRLWLGSIEAVEDWSRLQECGITDVLTCGRGLDTRLPSGVSRLNTLAIDDLDEVDILEHLPPTSDLIREVLTDSARAVLVHCAAGRSRSASIVIAYLMREDALSYEDARKSVEAKRSIVQPNTGFSHQLAWYGRNTCPRDLVSSSGVRYTSVREFSHLLRTYSASDVRGIVVAAGAADADCQDRKALQRALDALDRLQNAHPLDEAARAEKKQQSRRLNAALD